MNQPETLTIKVIAASCGEYYFTVMIDEHGCVEMGCTVHGETEPYQKFTIAPEDSFAVADALKVIAQEELNIAGF